MPKTRGCQNK